MSNVRKPDILITTAWYPTDKSTSGVFVKEQGEALCRAGHRVTVLLVTYSTLLGWFRQSRPQFDKSELLNVVHLHIVFPLPGRFFGDATAYFKRTILKRTNAWMKRHIEEKGKPGIIHHHCLSDNSYIAGSLAKNFNIPYVFTEHSNYFSYDELNKFNSFETFEDHRQFIAGARVRIAVSQVRGAGYTRIFGSPFVVVSNMVQELFAVPISRSANPDLFTFVCVAILDKRKRQDILLNAFARKFRGQAVHLHLAGSGVMSATYRKLATELGIDSQVTFCGKIGRSEVKKIFDDSHVAVLSSDEETFGVVLAEAMFRGIPVISTISGGPEEIVTRETGLLCKKGDAAVLGAALEEMRNNYLNYSSARIREYAESHFSEDIIVRKLEDIYAVQIA